MVRLVIIGVIVAVLAAIISERKKRSQQVAKLAEMQRSLLSANDSGPTGTGKFRVQQMLSTSEKLKATIAPQASTEEDPLQLDESAPLPDPFHKSNKE